MKKILFLLILVFLLSGCGNIKPTTTWETYNNEIHKFQITYPSDWLLQKEVGYPPETIISKRWDDNGYCSLNLFIILEDFDSMGEVEWYRQNGYKEESYSINNMLAIKFSKFPVENNAPVGVIYFDNTSDRITMVASSDKYEYCLDYFNKMISSYKTIQ